MIIFSFKILVEVIRDIPFEYDTADNLVKSISATAVTNDTKGIKLIEYGNDCTQ